MQNANPWSLYDDLIAAIPPELTVSDCTVGLHWTLVRSLGVGIAMTPPEGERRLRLPGPVRGAKVRDIAALAKSWNGFEAALGVAAINSFINTPTVVPADWLSPRPAAPGGSTFEQMLPEIAGKRVAVVGHFPNLDLIAGACSLHILERRPQSGDFPDPACEYLLPSMDYVFITGSTLINKTLPRLLELSRQATTVVVGPTTPLTPLLFRYGASRLAGSVVRDPQAVWQQVVEGGDRSIFQNGVEMVQSRNERGAHAEH
jgi:uncharacterized protein (DUF4213/DUF364 family)